MNRTPNASSTRPAMLILGVGLMISLVPAAAFIVGPGNRPVLAQESLGDGGSDSQRSKSDYVIDPVRGSYGSIFFATVDQLVDESTNDSAKGFHPTGSCTTS